MAQLGRLTHTALTALGIPVSGATLTVYREGATVQGAQSGTSPLTVTVRHRGKIEQSDTVFIDTTTGTTYNVDSQTDTTVVLSGFAGTLALADGARIHPNNVRPSIYDDDQGGGTALSNSQKNTDSNGFVEVFGEYQAVDFLVNKAGLVTRQYTGVIMPTEAPAQVRYADAFATNSATGGIQEAIDDLPTNGGLVQLGPKTYSIPAKLTLPSNTTLAGVGMGLSIIKLANSANVIALENADTVNGNSYIALRDLTVDGNNANQTSNTNVLINMKRVTALSVERCEIANCRADGLYIQCTSGTGKAVQVRGCYFHDTLTNTNTNGHGAVIVFSSGGTERQICIVNNVFENSGTANATTGISEAAINITGTSDSSTDVVVSGNSVYNTWGNGIYATDVLRVDISNNIVFQSGQQNVVNGGNGIFCNFVDRCVVNGNIIETIAANSDNCIEVTGSATGDVVISNNHCRGAGTVSFKAGIGCGGNARLVITGNNCSNNSRGIQISEASGVTINDLVIVGNACVANTSHGMDIRGYGNLVISGNDCRGNGNSGIQIGEGITVSGSEPVSVTVSANALCSNTDDGLTISGEIVGPAGNLARRVSVAGNTCSLNTRDGMRLSDMSGLTVSGNVISGNLNDGIQFAGASLIDCVVDGNVIRDHSAGGKFGIHVLSSSVTRLVIGPSNILQNNNTNITADAGVPALTGATPDVSGVSRARLADGTAKTNFTGGYDGQVLTLVATTGQTLTNGATLNLSTSVDFVMNADDCIILMRRNGNWYEMGRGDNS